MTLNNETTMEDKIKELNELRDKFTGIKNEPLVAVDFASEEDIETLITYYKGKIICYN